MRHSAHFNHIKRGTGEAPFNVDSFKSASLKYTLSSLSHTKNKEMCLNEAGSASLWRGVMTLP